MPSLKASLLNIHSVLESCDRGAEGVIEIPEGVTHIGYDAFGNCSSLTSIEIPSGVTRIGRDAFNGCSYLSRIEIPEGVKSIGKDAFHGCRSLSNALVKVAGAGDGLSKGTGSADVDWLMQHICKAGVVGELIGDFELEKAVFNVVWALRTSMILSSRFVSRQLREEVICYLLCMRRLTSTRGSLPTLPHDLILIIFNSAHHIDYSCTIDYQNNCLKGFGRSTEYHMFRGFGG